MCFCGFPINFSITKDHNEKLVILKLSIISPESREHFPILAIHAFLQFVKQQLGELLHERPNESGIEELSLFFCCHVFNEGLMTSSTRTNNFTYLVETFLPHKRTIVREFSILPHIVTTFRRTIVLRTHF